MNKSMPITALAVMWLTLGGCSANRPLQGQIKTSFATHIDKQGSKQFSYSVYSERPRDNSAGKGDRANNGEGQRRRGGGGQGTSPRTGRSQVVQIEQTLIEALEEKLQQTGYCRDGYYRLDSYFSRSRSYIRGECRESASNSDIKKFPNNKIETI